MSEQRIAIMCQCKDFFILNESWHPDKENRSILRNSMICTGCGHQICIEIMDKNDHELEIYDLTQKL